MQFSDVCVRLGGEIRYREANRNDSYAVNDVYACFSLPSHLFPVLIGLLISYSARFIACAPCLVVANFVIPLPPRKTGTTYCNCD